MDLCYHWIQQTVVDAQSDDLFGVPPPLVGRILSLGDGRRSVRGRWWDEVEGNGVVGRMTYEQSQSDRPFPSPSLIQVPVCEVPV